MITREKIDELIDSVHNKQACYYCEFPDRVCYHRKELTTLAYKLLESAKVKIKEEVVQ